MSIVMLSQTRSLRARMKELEDLHNKWNKEREEGGGGYVSREDSQRDNDLVRIIREAGFAIHYEWDYDNNREVVQLSIAPYPKEE